MTFERNRVQRESLACYRAKRGDTSERSITCYTVGRLGAHYERLFVKTDGINERNTKMANMRKFSDMKDIGHLCAHYERSVPAGHYTNPDIDETKIKDDCENLAPDRGKQTDYIKEQIKKIMDSRTLRKDAVRMCCWIVDTPKGLPEEKKKEFFKETYNFLVDRYGSKSGMGEDVVISAYIHKSESTDHIHFAFLPVIERDGEKTFCAKECVGRDDLKTFHEDLASYMEQTKICKRTDILNGKTQRDASGRALSVKELKRNRNIERERKVDRWSNRTDVTERRRDRW